MAATIAVPLDEQVRRAPHLDRGRPTMSSTRWASSSGDAGPMWIFEY